MKKTLFAGLTALDPGESIAVDDYALVTTDPLRVDRFLEVGSVTHRHDARAALGNPTASAGASAVGSGGAIPAGETFYAAYTLLDEQNGETLPSDAVAITTPDPIEPPDSEPTAVIDYTSGGTLPADTYYYVVSLLDGIGGETPAGPWAQVEREPGFASGRVLISGLQGLVASGSAAGWALYRATGGGTFHFLAQGSGDTFTDDGSTPADCGRAPLDENVNTTNGDNSIEIVVPASAMTDANGRQASGFSLYLSRTGDFSSPCLHGSSGSAAAGETVVVRLYDPQPGRPPDVSLSVRGASKIDPDTEILDWHWKRPVATSDALPAAEAGDVRLVLDDGTLWAAIEETENSSGWQLVGGLGGGSGTVDLEHLANGQKVIWRHGGSGFVELWASSVGGDGTLVLDDQFSVDSASAYTYDADTTYAGSGFSVAGGVLDSVTSAEKHLWRNDVVVPSGDFELVSKVHYDASWSGGHGLYFRRHFAADNHDDNLHIGVVAGSKLSIAMNSGAVDPMFVADSSATIGIGDLSGAETFWLRLLRDGDTYEAYFHRADPSGGASAVASAAYTLANAEEVAEYGSAASGRVMLVSTSDDLQFDDVRAYVRTENRRELRLAVNEYDGARHERLVLGDANDTDFGGVKEVAASGSGSVAPVDAIMFAPSGDVEIDVSEVGGSAVVTIGVDVPPAADEFIGQIAASGSGSVAPASAVMFRGSGTVTVSAADASGSAVVTVTGSEPTATLIQSRLASRGMGRVVGGNSATARPDDGFAFYDWLQEEEPVNAIAGDTWSQPPT
jgi:hypothetical protein